jgi:drug/metabolite transporter (DMT)-like permease
LPRFGADPAQFSRARYDPVNVTAWAYVVAASCMGATAAAVVDRAQWAVPPALWGPLLYWIFVASVVGYYLLTWATQHLPASQVGR